ncbi:EamA family transporter, partial [Streptomyces daliensis]|nr:EamA family transporter [Streptomyces daliensis]
AQPPAPARAPATGSTLLLLQPVMAIGFGIGFLGERPTLTQYAGCALVVLTVWRASRTDH